VLLESNQDELALDMYREALDTGVIYPWSSRNLGVLDLSRLPPLLCALALRTALQDMRDMPPARYYHSSAQDLVIMLGAATGSTSDTSLLDRLQAVNEVLSSSFGLRASAAQVYESGCRYCLLTAAISCFSLTTKQAIVPM
jgi:hypothetical protein